MQIRFSIMGSGVSALIDRTSDANATLTESTFVTCYFHFLNRGNGHGLQELWKLTRDITPKEYTLTWEQISVTHHERTHQVEVPRYRLNKKR